MTCRLTGLIFLIHFGVGDAGVNDKHKIRQSLVMIRTLVFPALIKEVVELLPFFQLKYSLEFQLDDLEMLGDDVGLC